MSKCPDCGSEDIGAEKAPDGFFGNWIKCRKCGKVFRLVK